MSPQFKSFLLGIVALMLLIGTFVIFESLNGGLFGIIADTQSSSAANVQSAATAAILPTAPAISASSTPSAAAPSKASTSAPPPTKKTTPATTAQPATPPAPQPSATSSNQVSRIENPYAFPPESSDAVNAQARAALVNILCMPQGGGSILHPISGSGVIIDSRGVILTNAHVAQYVLLSQDPRMGLRCFVRTGAPAVARWSMAVLYIPPVWVQEHAADISLQHPTGTGEHDYALLRITNSVDGSPLPASFASITPDTREGVTFVDDQVLAASYPAEFLGGLAAQYDLYPGSSVTNVKNLLTFDTGTIDLLSLGGIIEAQSGSSGGPVVNVWGRLVGLITTTSQGDTTADRDLRAITLSYIDRDMHTQSGQTLETILNGDVTAETIDFSAHIAPGLTALFLPFLQ